MWRKIRPAHHQVRQDQRLRVVFGRRKYSLAVAQQEGAHVDEHLYLVGTLLGGLADDRAARALPDEHDRLGLCVQHPGDPLRVALQRDLGDRGVVVAEPGKVRGLHPVAGALQKRNHLLPAPAPDNPPCTNTNVPIPSLLYCFSAIPADDP